MSKIANYQVDIAMLHQKTQTLWNQVNDLIAMLNSHQYDQAEGKLNQYKEMLEDTFRLMKDLKRRLENGIIN